MASLRVAGGLRRGARGDEPVRRILVVPWAQGQNIVGAHGEDRYEALLGDVARAISLVAEGSHDAPGGPAKGNPQS